MKAQIFSLCIFACTACAFDIDDALDRLDSTLTISGFQDNFRARLSGTVDLEFYNFQQPAPGLIDSEIDNLFNPRLTLFLDAQAGSQVYFFAQSRFDRGFDPSDHGAEVRLDEYALRITPWQDGRFNYRSANSRPSSAIGSRGTYRGTTFINAPLVYENVTAIQDKYAPYSPLYFIYAPYYYGKYVFNPVIWGPDYASGISVSGRLGRFDYAVEMKNASLSSRPESCILPRMASKIRLLAAGSDSGLTKLGISASRLARAHIFGVKQNHRCHPVGTSATIESLFLDKTSVSHGITCNYGPSFMKRVFKSRTWEMRTHLLITSKRNTNLHRSCLAPFVGTSNYLTKSVMATAVKNAGVQTSAESTSPLPIVSPRTCS